MLTCIAIDDEPIALEIISAYTAKVPFQEYFVFSLPIKQDPMETILIQDADEAIADIVITALRMEGYRACRLSDNQENILEVNETIDRLVMLLEKNGAIIYSRINQQSEVTHVGREMPPMEFILFGNPAIGGAIMAANPIAALDLPLKILAWKDENQVVWVAFNDPAYIQNRYMLPSKLVASLNLTPLIDKALNINQ